MVMALRSLKKLMRDARAGCSARVHDHIIHSSVDFRSILQRERALVDRNSHEFSVVIVVLPEGAARTHNEIFDFLARRMRLTDEIGWLDGLRVGVLLRFTGPAGAWKLAQTVSHKLTRSGAPPVCRVYTYPSDDGDRITPPEDPRQRQFMEMFPDWHREDGGPRVAAGAPAGRRMPSLTGSRSETAVTATTYRVAQASGSEGVPLLTPPIPGGKRAMDIILSLLALALLSPLLLALAVYVKLVSPGPIFFSQERIGYMGRTFICWKFRTMHHKADTGVHQQHLKTLIRSDVPMTKLDSRQDNRLIPLAGLIRATGIDELPQLLNVLRGDMSLIGPRPCVRYEFDQYDRWHKQRFDTLPGLTGLWQVSGKNRTTFSEMMRLDVGYSHRKSLWTDLLIMAKTVPTLVGEATRAVNRKKVPYESHH